MFSIIANNKTQAQVEITSATPTPQFMNAIAINYGGVAADYSFYTLTNEEYERVGDGDDFLLVWAGEKLIGVDFKPEDEKGWLRSEISLPSNKVTLNSIDVEKVRIFNKGDVYVQNEVVFNENSIWRCQETLASKDPGVNTTWTKEAPAVLLTLTVLLADKTTVDSSANFIARYPVVMPNEQIADMEVEFISGIGKKIVILNNIGSCGQWLFPGDINRINLNEVSYRIDNVASFSGLLPF